MKHSHRVYIPRFDGEDVLNPCPLCGGRLAVKDGDLAFCLDCDELIGWYLPTVGGIRFFNETAEGLC